MRPRTPPERRGRTPPERRMSASPQTLTGIFSRARRRTRFRRASAIPRPTNPANTYPVYARFSRERLGGGGGGGGTGGAGGGVGSPRATGTGGGAGGRNGTAETNVLPYRTEENVCPAPVCSNGWYANPSTVPFPYVKYAARIRYAVLWKPAG